MPFSQQCVEFGSKNAAAILGRLRASRPCAYKGQISHDPDYRQESGVKKIFIKMLTRPGQVLVFQLVLQNCKT